MRFFIFLFCVLNICFQKKAQSQNYLFGYFIKNEFLFKEKKLNKIKCNIIQINRKKFTLFSKGLFYTKPVLMSLLIHYWKSIELQRINVNYGRLSIALKINETNYNNINYTI